jgi:FkbM family methyltransferase
VGVLARVIDKPYFVWRPTQVVRRLTVGRRRPAEATVMLPLPWGASIECFSGEAIGSSIARTGLYDLLLTEAIFRLADGGETALDVGANVGYASSALASAVGPAGCVVAVEPHPAVHAVLARNADRWAGLSEFEVHALALSDLRGRGRLTVGEEFASNRGTATLSPEREAITIADVEVDLGTLDELAGGRAIGVLKLDVEGHELQVLEGGREQLAAHRVRDILVEQQDGYPGPVTALLEDQGYAIFGMRQSLLGPRIVAPDEAIGARYLEPPTLIATIDPDRLQRRFRPRGWRALRRPRKGLGATFVHRATRP